MENIKKYKLCPKCKRMRMPYIKNIDYCQTCYREMLDEYSLYDYAIEKRKIKGTSLRICEMLIEEGIDRKEIHKILNLNKIYVQQIISKYTIRVNSDGKKRPF